MKLPHPRDNQDVAFFEYIADPGWGIKTVSKDRKSPSYSFSVGLYYTFHHPELVVTGLPRGLAEDILNDAGELIAEGHKFEHLAKSDEIIESFSCAFCTVDVRNYERYLGYATWFYGELSEPFPCLQLLWPDKKGVLPHEDGVDKNLLKHQPLFTTFRG